MANQATPGDSLFRIHPPDVIGKYAPDSVIGTLGGGGGAAPVAGGAAAGGGAPGIPMSEVAKHASKADCWVVVTSHFAISSFVYCFWTGFLLF